MEEGIEVIGETGGAETGFKKFMVTADMFVGALDIGDVGLVDGIDGFGWNVAAGGVVKFGVA